MSDLLSTLPVVTKLELFAFFDGNGPEFTTFDSFNSGVEESYVSHATFHRLKSVDLKCIIHGQDLSAEHLGGDTLVGVVHDVLEAQKEGYKIAYWYGHDAEVLVVAYRPDQLRVQEGVPALRCKVCNQSEKQYGLARLGEQTAFYMRKHPLNCQCGAQMEIVYVPET